jgi:Protein of unknown function (DUF1559)
MHRFAVLGLLLAAPAFAAPRPFAETAAPFIDEHTLVVVRADMSRVDVDSLLKLAAAYAGADQAGEITPTVRAWFKDFVAKGGRDVFFTYGPGDFPNVPCLIVPIGESPPTRNDLGVLVSMILKEAGQNVQVAHMHGCVCVGTKNALAVLKARKAVNRPELNAALEADKDGVVQIAFALSAEAKKIHEQVAPTLPTELGGGSIRKITRGMKWMALSIGVGPKMPAKWITEAASPEAAQDLRQLEERAPQALIASMLKGEQDPDQELLKRLKGLIAKSSTTTDGTRITTEWDLATTLLEAVKVPEGPPAERMRSANNLKQLLLALHNYHDTYGHMPHDIRDKDGKPLLSWRVQILPFIEQDQIYKQFKLDEPWDSENNKKLIDKMPRTLRSPRQAEALKDRTTYLAPQGKGLMWDEPKGLKISQITDGTSNTIALVEADDERAVIWSKPEDITIDPKNPIAGLLGHYVEGFQVALADGSVRFIKKSIDPMVLWAMFTRNGGEAIGLEK